MKDFLSKLKIDDTVIVQSGRHGQEIRKVKRLTNTQIVLDDDRKYRKDNGDLVGQRESYYHVYLEEATEERLYDIRLKRRKGNIKYAIENGVLDKFSDEQILNLWIVVKPLLKN